METREEHGNALLINGEDMLARCGEGQARSLKASLEKLKEKMYDTREKAERKRWGYLILYLSKFLNVYCKKSHTLTKMTYR